MSKQLVKYTLPLHQADQDLGGGKAAGLSKLISGSFEVPPGFVVSTHAYQLATNQLQLDNMLATNPESIRSAIEQAEIPQQLREEIIHQLIDSGLHNQPVAVRSSATAEDQSDSSFAGQQETYLGVVGADEVLHAIQKCWGSLWSKHALDYREQAGYSHKTVALAVVVQALIDSEVAGVMFTSSANSTDQRTIINASWGLGESVVSGQVTPDEFQCKSGAILHKTLGTKETRIDRDSNTTIFTKVSHSCQAKYCMEESKIIELSNLGDEITIYFNQAMDVEWALAKNKIWILQARPITSEITNKFAESSNSNSKVKTVSGKNVNKLSRTFRSDLIEHYPGPYPLDLCAIERMHAQLQKGMQSVGIQSTPIEELITLEENGSIRVHFPDVKLNLNILKLLRVNAPNPHDWPDVEKKIKSQIFSLRKEQVSSKNESELLDYLDRVLQLADDIALMRFKDYVGPAQIVGARINLWLKFAGFRDIDSYDLLRDLDFTTALIDQELHVLASMDVESTEYKLKFQKFLDQYGARTSSLYLPFSHKSWRESPENLEKMLVVLHDSGSERPSQKNIPFVELQNIIIKKLPRIFKKFFNHDVQVWRAGHIARESSVYLIEETYILARNAIFQLSDQLVFRGLLKNSEDIKYLTLTEIKDSLSGEINSKNTELIVVSRSQSRPIVANDWWEGLTGYGNEALKGVSGSGGVVTGPARIISGPNEFGRLQKGDILICKYTDPSWTPLFRVASGVVADTGGRLSHAAIVAREYGIPAVMGTGRGTAKIHDGQLVTVDGNNGSVKVMN